MSSQQHWLSGLAGATLALHALFSPAVAVAASASGSSLAISGAALPAAGTLTITPRFSAGDAFTLRVARSKHVEDGGQRSSSQGSGGDIRIRVLANDAAGSRLECVYGAVSQDEETDPEIRNNPLMQVMTASREGMVVRFATGPGFTNPHVENVDEVLAHYRQSLAQATRMMPPEIGTAVLRLIEPMLVNKQVFAAKLVEELYVYFQVIGAEVPLQGARTGASVIGSPGGAPVKTWNNLRVEHHDRAAGRVTLRYQQDSNPQDVKALAQRLAGAARKEAAQIVGGGSSGNDSSGGVASGVASGMAPQAAAAEAGMEPAPPPPAAAAGISVQDVATYDIELATGWPEQVRRVRTLRQGTQVLVDEMTFSRVQ